MQFLPVRTTAQPFSKAHGTSGWDMSYSGEQAPYSCMRMWRFETKHLTAQNCDHCSAMYTGCLPLCYFKLKTRAHLPACAVSEEGRGGLPNLQEDHGRPAVRHQEAWRASGDGHHHCRAPSADPRPLHRSVPPLPGSADLPRAAQALGTPHIGAVSACTPAHC